MVSVGRVCQDYAAELSCPSLDELWGWQDGDEENLPTLVQMANPANSDNRKVGYDGYAMVCPEKYGGGLSFRKKNRRLFG